MIQTLELLEQYKNLEKIKGPFIPKSRAKDINGFSQKEIMKLIKGDTMKETVNKFKWIITKNSKNQTQNTLYIIRAKLSSKKSKFSFISTRKNFSMNINFSLMNYFQRIRDFILKFQPYMIYMRKSD